MKTVKKIISGVLATVSAFGCGAMLAGCESDHPEAQMVISFNDKTYTLEYELSRNVTPATVNHFIWLVDNGYYNGLCVHDYDEDSRMYTGGYKAATDETDADGLTEFAYYTEIAKFGNYSAFPHSVWLDSGKSLPTYTLYGEFENNNVQVQNGKIYDKFGSLSMYYHDLDNYEEAKTDVWGARESGSKLYKRTYETNSATSLFYINLDEDSNTYSKSYCTFASLKSGSVSVLKNLIQAIEDYAEEDFTEEHTVRVNADDQVLGEHEVNVKFDVPTKEIKIQSLKMIKY